jgi:hypothetical protein
MPVLGILHLSKNQNSVNMNTTDLLNHAAREKAAIFIGNN